MRIPVLTAAAALAAFALAGCDGASRPGGSAPTPSRSYAATNDVSGYYLPMDEARFGDWRLGRLFVGRADGSPPALLEFEPLAGGTPVQVRPTGWLITDAQVRVEGRSAELGAVIFDGRLDQGSLATARRNLGDEGVVMTGSLKVGDAPPQAVRLRWWMGD